jgi:pimeloyl-ACP methyl ester carboxylesterase
MKKWILIILLIVLGSLSACGAWVRFRTQDHKIIKQFQKKGYDPSIHYTFFQGLQMRHIHSQAFDSLKPTLFFVHGAPGSSNNFDLYLQDTVLNSQFNMISVDRLGYGFSEFGKAYPNIHFQAASLVPLIQTYAHEDQSLILIGWSYGGPIVAKLGMDLPNTISATLLLAPALDPQAERYFKIGKLAEWKMTRWMIPKPFEVAQIEKNAHAKELLLLENKWQSTQIPVWMIHGTEDKIVPYLANTNFAKTHFPEDTFTLLPIEGVGHVFPIRNPKKVIQFLLTEIKNLNDTD